ncbi:hypothetical protein Ccrd_009654, partial [Cynara cardunculus var. scolymus]
MVEDSCLHMQLKFISSKLGHAKSLHWMSSNTIAPDDTNHYFADKPITTLHYAYYVRYEAQDALIVSTPFSIEAFTCSNFAFSMLQDIIPHGDQKKDKASFLLEIPYLYCLDLLYFLKIDSIDGIWHDTYKIDEIDVQIFLLRTYSFDPIGGTTGFFTSSFGTVIVSTPFSIEAFTCSNFAFSGNLNLLVNFPLLRSTLCHVSFLSSFSTFLSPLICKILSSSTSTFTSSFLIPGRSALKTCASGVSFQSTRVFTKAEVSLQESDPDEVGKGKSLNGSQISMANGSKMLFRRPPKKLGMIDIFCLQMDEYKDVPERSVAFFRYPVKALSRKIFCILSGNHLSTFWKWKDLIFNHKHNNDEKIEHGFDVVNPQSILGVDY